MSIWSAIATPLMVASTVMSAFGASKAAKAQRESGEAAAEATLAEGKLAAHTYLEQGAALAEAGEVERTASRFEAAQMDIAAGEERAASQRAAEEEMRQARLNESRAIAIAGASGGGVADPTIVRLLAELDEQGEYKSLVALHQGETLARGLQLDAKIRRWEGDQAYRAGQIALRSAKTKAAMVLDSSGRIAALQREGGSTAATATLVSGYGAMFGRFADYAASR